MKKVFMIHGFQGEPNGGWRPWLMGELAQNDVWACALAMPTPDIPNKDEWVKKISEEVQDPDEDVFLVGHSLGVPTILRYLETLSNGSKIGGVILVSGTAFKVKKDGYEQVNSFLETSFDFEHIKNVCKNFVVIHGDDDPNVPFSDAEYLSNQLSCNLILIHNGKHLNGSAGIYKLPEALESLLKILNS